MNAALAARVSTGDASGARGRWPRGRFHQGSVVESVHEGARTVIASSDPRGTACADGFIAGWQHALEPPGEGLAGLRAARPGAFVAATRDGLTLERGPYGGRSLYYARDAHDVTAVTVSSSLRALVEALPAAPALNVDRLGALGLARIGPDPRATVYRDVFRVLPCEEVSFAPDGTTRTRFRLPHVPERSNGAVGDHARALIDVLSDILARELLPLRAVAVQTGGGLDSAGMFALVARHARRHGGAPRLTALAMDFAGPGDDRPHLQALLAHVGGEALRVLPEEVRPLSLGFFDQDAWPYTWPTCPMAEALDRRARAWGADAMVTGFGGDFVLDGDLASFAHRLGGGDLRAVGDAARLRVPWSSSPWGRVGRWIAKPFVLPLVPVAWRAHRRKRARRASETWRWAGPRLRPLLADRGDEGGANDDWLTAFATSHAMMEGADGLGQTELAWGLPYIAPYLDPRVVELMASFPPEQLLTGGWLRGLFRVAMKGLLPESVRLRRDKASFEPMLDATFAAAGGMNRFRPLLAMEACGDLGLVEPARFRESFARVAQRVPTPRGWLGVWPMLAVEAFLQGRPGRRRAGHADA